MMTNLNCKSVLLSTLYLFACTNPLSATAQESGSSAGSVAYLLGKLTVYVGIFVVAIVLIRKLKK